MKKIVFLSLLSFSMNISFSQTACDSLYFNASVFINCDNSVEGDFAFNKTVDSATVTFNYSRDGSSYIETNIENYVKFRGGHFSHFTYASEIDLEIVVSNIVLNGVKCSNTIRESYASALVYAQITSETLSGDYGSKKPYVVEISALIVQPWSNSYSYNGSLDIYQFSNQRGNIATINFIDGKGVFTIDKPGTYYLLDPICSRTRNVRIVDSLYGKFRGKTAFDLNNSCSYEKYIDQLLPFQQISVNDGEFILTSNKDGDYEAVLPYGTYTLKPIVDTTKVNVCYKGVELTISKTNIQREYDFVTRLKNFHDQGVQLGGSRARPGFEYYYQLNYQNKSTFSEKSTLKFIQDAKVDFISSTDTNYIISGDTLIWNKNLDPNTTGNIRLVFKVPANVALLGDTIITEAQISSDSTDIYLADNRSKSKLIIVGSFDPNDISLTTEPYNNTSNIQLEDTVLNYIIRFENEGTAEATNIKIVNDLPEYLNASTTKIIAKSHDMHWNVIGNSLEFHFEEINLPSRNDSELENQGFIEYSVKQKKTNELGNIIKNQANIYFDFNPAITTNQTSNTIGHSVGLNKKQLQDEAIIYPNPFENSFTIDKLNSGTIQIFDIKGNLLNEMQVDEESNFGSNLTKGVYFIKIYNQEEVLVKRVIKF